MLKSKYGKLLDLNIDNNTQVSRELLVTVVDALDDGMRYLLVDEKGKLADLFSLKTSCSDILFGLIRFLSSEKTENEVSNLYDFWNRLYDFIENIATGSMYFYYRVDFVKVYVIIKAIGKQFPK